MVSYNSYRTAVLHYIDDALGFLFFWSLSVVCTGLTLGKYFVHVNICLIAPPETWDVCFQVVVSGLCVQCSYLSGSAVTLAVCILACLHNNNKKKQRGVQTPSHSQLTQDHRQQITCCCVCM